MIPIMLDAVRLRIGLAGRGALAVRRLEWFRRLGAAPELFSDEPGDELIAATPEEGPRVGLQQIQRILLDPIAPEPLGFLSHGCGGEQEG